MCVCILNDPKANAVILPSFFSCRIHAIHCRILPEVVWDSCKGKSGAQYVSNKSYHFFFVEHLEPVSKIECFLLIETLPPQ